MLPSLFYYKPAAQAAPPAVGTEEHPGPVTDLGQTQEPSTDTSTNAGETSPPKGETAVSLSDSTSPIHFLTVYPGLACGDLEPIPGCVSRRSHSLNKIFVIAA